MIIYLLMAELSDGWHHCQGAETWHARAWAAKDDLGCTPFIREIKVEQPNRGVFLDPGVFQDRGSFGAQGLSSRMKVPSSRMP